MLRYFVLATAIVVGAGVIIAGWMNRDMLRVKLASVYASAPPKAEPAEAIGTGSNVGLRGDAPWALSALPECLVQKSESTGPRAYVLAHLPPGAAAIEPPATLRVRDCGIELAGDAIYVRRGPDRFRNSTAGSLVPLPRRVRAPARANCGRVRIARLRTFGRLDPARMTIEEEVCKRRTFAIISHPDAGKTTLTEKLLLYGGAIHVAGQVCARKRQRQATSDWMALERERGISITSTILQFPYRGFTLNLLDTPGHQDFGEDTYRTLLAADSAVMLIDAAKGVEPQTKKLFAIAATAESRCLPS